MITRFFTLVILTSLVSCINDKEDVTTLISGNVKDYYSNQAQSSVKVGIYDLRVDPKNPLLRQGDPYDTTRFLTSGFTDDNGNYTISTNQLEKGINYAVVCNDKNIICDTISYIIGGTTGIANLLTKRFKKLYLHLKNTTMDCDRLTISTSCNNKLTNNNSINKLKLDTVMIYSSIPDELFEIDLNYFKQGQIIKEHEIKRTIANKDTMNINLEY